MDRYYDERRIRTLIKKTKDTAITTFIAFNLGLIPLSPFVVINIIGITEISSNYAFIISRYLLVYLLQFLFLLLGS
jgi:hypothetical protein